jgi:hypothetical protein
MMMARSCRTTMRCATCAATNRDFSRAASISRAARHTLPVTAGMRLNRRYISRQCLRGNDRYLNQFAIGHDHPRAYRCGQPLHAHVVRRGSTLQQRLACPRRQVAQSWERWERCSCADSLLPVKRRSRPRRHPTAKDQRAADIPHAIRPDVGKFRRATAYCGWILAFLPMSANSRPSSASRLAAASGL